MELQQPISVRDLAAQIHAQVVGDDSLKVTHISEIHKVRKGSLIFVDNPKYFSQAIYSSAVAIIINEAVECPPGKALLIVKEPFKAYNSLALHYNPPRYSTVQIAENAKIGKNVILEHGVVIGENVTIGDECHIRANTVISNDTKIGYLVIIHPNASIGSDAFYFHRKKNREYTRWHSIGRVIIEDDVEIGAGCTIDKGVSGNTIIGTGTKIDNQVHLGHGVVVGKHCLIAAQVGVAGKTIIQDHVTLYGQVGVSKSLVIGEGATILAKTGVSKSIPGGDRQYFGAPAAEARTRFKEIAALRRLPDLLRRFDKLETLMYKGRGKDAPPPVPPIAIEDTEE